MRILDSIKEMLDNKSSVQMVADDPQMTSEILLLVRMMFADGELSGEELALFKKICKSVFDIPEEDVPEVISFLKDFGYETSGEQAAETFIDMPDDRKRTLMRHLIAMARADKSLHESEVTLIARVARVLGYTPEQVREGM
ncbi:MAG: TerB family tellurite resistance protein [Rhizobiaceae bacterium]